MNEPDLDTMEAGARAANKGDWYGPKTGKIIIIKQDAIHIANCSPPAIISMINDIRNLRKKLAKKDTEVSCNCNTPFLMQKEDEDENEEEGG